MTNQTVHPLTSRIHKRDTGPIYVKPGVYIKIFSRDCCQQETVYNSQLDQQQAAQFRQIMTALTRLYTIREVIHNGTIQVWYAAINPRGAYRSAFRAQRVLAKQMAAGKGREAIGEYYATVVHYPAHIRGNAADSLSARRHCEGY